MVTPIKKIEGVELLDWQKAFNTAINQTRAVVERVTRVSQFSGAVAGPWDVGTRR
jgi:hypothetical protein